MSNTFEVISPIDQSVLLERNYASGPEIEVALSAAQQTQISWQQTLLEERIAICRRAVDWLVNQADSIGLDITRQMGRPIRYSPFEINKGLAERAQHMIDIAADSLRDLKVEDSNAFRRYIRRRPLGTILVLAPWNYPFLTSVNVIIPALLAGNTVLFKTAEQTPLCAETFARAFEDSGCPPGVFQYLHLTHDQVARVIADQRIHYVAFTGSVVGGQAIQAAVGQRFIGAGLELGGKDPAYVRADADLSNAIENLVDGTYFNSGQSCCGIERIYVDEKYYDDFVEGFTELVKKYVLGDPLNEKTTLGPMVRTSSATRVIDQINQAVMAGAKALIDPKHFPGHRPGTPYLAPQVLVKVDHGMEIMTQETFGPVVGIMKVSGDAEAIQLMNDSDYGLTASIWTSDLDRAATLGQQLATGTVFANRCDYLDPALAWTGVKNSGRGATLSTIGYESLTRPQSFHLKNIL